MSNGAVKKRRCTRHDQISGYNSAPDFEALDAIRHLDVKALAKSARAEIGLGYINSCCERQMVRAVIRKGMVTGLRVDEPPKKGRTPISPELAKLLRMARNAAV